MLRCSGQISIEHNGPSHRVLQWPLQAKQLAYIHRAEIHCLQGSQRLFGLGGLGVEHGSVLFTVYKETVMAHQGFSSFYSNLHLLPSIYVRPTTVCSREKLIIFTQ